ncbi:MAG TPA: hypothetical protein VMV94_00600 [Phycisphaerae bacterium]|nr:hypothetical protein [Phycisphaerae bacterium]
MQLLSLLLAVLDLGLALALLIAEYVARQRQQLRDVTLIVSERVTEKRQRWERRRRRHRRIRH